MQCLPEADDACAEAAQAELLYAEQQQQHRAEHSPQLKRRVAGRRRAK